MGVERTRYISEFFVRIWYASLLHEYALSMWGNTSWYGYGAIFMELVRVRGARCDVRGSEWGNVSFTAWVFILLRRPAGNMSVDLWRD